MTIKEFVNRFKELLQGGVDHPVAEIPIDRELLSRFFDDVWVVGGQLRPTNKKDRLEYEVTFFVVPNVDDAPCIDVD